MLDYWTALRSVNVISTVDDPAMYIAKLVRKSDPEAWLVEVNQIEHATLLFNANI
jgi:hypothetical protein